MSKGSRQQAQNILLNHTCYVYNGDEPFAKSIKATVDQISNWKNRGDRIPYHFLLLIYDQFKDLVSLDIFYPEFKELNQRVRLYKIEDGLYSVAIDMTKVTLPEIALRDEIQALLQMYNCSGQIVIVDCNYNVLVGFKRVAEFKQNRQVVIPAKVIDIEKHIANVEPIDYIVMHCSLLEKVIAGEIILQIMNEQSNKTGKNKRTCPKWDKATLRQDEIVSTLVGLGGKTTYHRAKYIVACGTKALINKVNKGNKDKFPISLAENIAKLIPTSQQAAFLKLDIKTQRAEVKALKKQITNNKLISQQDNNTFAQPKSKFDDKLYTWLREHNISITCTNKSGNIIYTLHDS